MGGKKKNSPNAEQRRWRLIDYTAREQREGQQRRDCEAVGRGYREGGVRTYRDVRNFPFYGNLRYYAR